MIWIKQDKRSFAVVSFNTHVEGEKYSIWGELMNGKTSKLKEGSQEEISEYKEALDFAIKNGHQVFEI